MKNKILIISALAIIALCVSCASVGYLPGPGQHVGSSQYGSYIRINTHNRKLIAGELIAVHPDGLIIRQHKKKSTYATVSTIIVPYQTISDFRLRYAEGSKYYAWPIPVLLASTFTHGVGVVITLPLNAIVSGVVASSAATEFVYAKREIGYPNLKMFARFPQGLPDHLRLEDIK